MTFTKITIEATPYRERLQYGYRLKYCVDSNSNSARDFSIFSVPLSNPIVLHNRQAGRPIVEGTVMEMTWFGHIKCEFTLF